MDICIYLSIHLVYVVEHLCIYVYIFLCISVSMCGTSSTINTQKFPPGLVQSSERGCSRNITRAKREETIFHVKIRDRAGATK